MGFGHWTCFKPFPEPDKMVQLSRNTIENQPNNGIGMFKKPSLEKDLILDGIINQFTAQ